MDRFNQNFRLFLDNLSKIGCDDELLEQYDYSSDPGDTYLQKFYSNCKSISNDIANRDEIIFSEGTVIMEGLNFNKLWNREDLSDENKEVIWNYLHTLYLFAYEHVNETDLKLVIKNFKTMGSDDETLDTETKALINIVNSLSKKPIEEEIVTEGAKAAGMSFELPEIFNGTIGNLAKEIAGEIDVDSINLDNPAGLIQDLLSGNLGGDNDDSGLMSLVKNISDKIQNKLSNGDLNEADLLSNAQEVMSNFSKDGAAGSSEGLGGLGGLGSIPGLGDMGNLGSIFQNLMKNMGSVQQGQAKTKMTASKKTLETKQRLRKKLKEKRELLAVQEKILQGELDNLETDTLPDIDDLVREIEGTHLAPKVKSKKKRKKNKKHLTLE